jgi:hypothetical protein
MRKVEKFYAVALATALASIGWAGVAAAVPAGSQPSHVARLGVLKEHAVTSARANVRLSHAVRPNVAGGALDYHGGPVQTSPKIYIDFWDWTGASSDPDGEMAYLKNFLSSIGNSNWLDTVHQYSSASADPVYESSWTDTANAVPASPTGKQIAAEAVAAGTHFGLPTGSKALNDIVVVAMPNGVSFNTAGPGDCAYHTYASTDLPFVAFPYIPSMGGGCGADSVNTGYAGNLNGVSITVGHETAETITDPWLNAWYQTNLSGEVADKCVWYNLSDIRTAKGIFSVQPLWSNAANWCTLGYKSGASSWSPQSEVSQSTSTTPSITTSGGSVIDAFKGHTSDAVYVIENSGNGWTTNYPVTGASTASSPAVAVLNGDIYVLWTSTASPYYVYESETAALGDSWSTPVIAGTGKGLPESSTGPRVCSTGSDLYSVYKGISTQVWITIFNGSTWNGQVSVPGAESNGSPAIACTAGTGEESIVWTETSDQVEMVNYFNGNFFSEDAVPGAKSDLGPSATTFEGVVNGDIMPETVVAWKSTSGTNIAYEVARAGIFGSVVDEPQAGTDNAPSIASAATWGYFTGDLTIYTSWCGATSKAVWLFSSNNP